MPHFNLAHELFPLMNCYNCCTFRQICTAAKKEKKKEAG